MIIEVDFNEVDHELDCDFGEVVMIGGGESGDSYAVGYNNGYAVGFREGKTAGYEEGHGVGYTEGKTDGYNQGYDTGHSTGYAEGYDAGYAKGYDEGYAKGKADGIAEVEATNAAILADINTALTEKGAESAESLTDVPEKIGSIEAGGGSSDDIRQYITKIPSFNNATFPTGYDLVLNCPQLTGGDDWASKFSNTNGLRSVTIIAPNANNPEINMTTCFVDARTVEIIDFTGFSFTISYFASVFMRCYLLREIRGELGFTSTANINAYSFYECRALKEIRFREGTIQKSVSFAQSPNLSADSRQSIVGGLADLTGKTAQIVTFHPTVYDALTEDEKATISAKNWTVARA